tara:strand:- start:2756 stop:2992 length:237 start_codon:yes stop_codon:yes gene_type:complete
MDIQYLPEDIMDIIMIKRFDLMKIDKAIDMFDDVICELMDIRLKKDMIIYDMMVRRRFLNLKDVQLGLSFINYYFSNN